MKKKIKKFSGNIVDVKEKRIYKGEISVRDGFILKIIPCENANDQYILPGFIDAHVHIESSMLTPGEFAKLAVRHGTVATVSDPHEIANVLGEKGVNFMINDGYRVPMKFYFGAPSCVPATPFETSGADINKHGIKKLLKRKDIHFLSEMMNYPGVINKDKEVMEKLKIAREMNKRIDGHAPGLRGKDLKIYVNEGITTDHECFDLQEAIEKIRMGMKIQIREGSAAKNFNTLYSLIDQFPEQVMLCTDDIHPHDLVNGHINSIIKKGLERKVNLFNLIRSATLNPVKHYGLKVGLLQQNDPADFIVVDNLRDLNISESYIDGRCVYKNGTVGFLYQCSTKPNQFYKNRITVNDVKIVAKENEIKVIEAIDGELVTRGKIVSPNILNGEVITDTETDILKVVVLSRYRKAKPVIGFIKGFGLKKGAFASSIAHDSHNIIAVGASDEDIVNAMNRIVENNGGIVVSDNAETMELKLEIAGIITSENGSTVASKYLEINKKIRQMGSELHAPLMTLSFMGLLVIPSLKIGDKGLFDVNKFEITPLFVNETY